jgi:trehalose/maltose hydrolase-like predicted phosphorylase
MHLLLLARGSAVTASTGAPTDGIRAGKRITVGFATQVIGPHKYSHGKIMGPRGGDGDAAIVTLKAGESATVVTVVGSNIDTKGGDALSAVKSAASAATAATIQAMASAHASWWAKYWSRSSISLPNHPLCERFWWSSQYHLHVIVIMITTLD